ncbi:mycofactocin biosynthesis chaperone MftB [Nocardiopsis gilva YIM 90087]|uniref:Mycofactocin biosynthesis chaperone MftB n=1 Tax=Nocardiopsis gilva YIM 90087 TaxID=1235441 RepID=A0A223S7Q5_9ACTN|nr:mycofactocin biosynthesis chaperone MftB [Nocardiopsis gilva]ASU84119.1 mycofactocin biosynthesis chaperone MftB [Nocardiopsis gilva YIM 90087]
MPEPADLDLDRAWDVHPQVAVRPEPFGALLYHFGTRRLSFLKDPRLLDVVRGLPDHPSARAACAQAGVTEAELPRYARALARLAATHMVIERPHAPAPAKDRP